VVVWKSQSPWPSLRGQLYDSSLEQTGGFWGVARATSNNLRDSDLAALAAHKIRSLKPTAAVASVATAGRPTLAAAAEAAATLGLFGGSSRGPPLHVQMNPSILACAVVNRGRHVYPPPRNAQPPVDSAAAAAAGSNARAGSTPADDGEAASTLFFVRATFRTVYGIQVRVWYSNPASNKPHLNLYPR
jgi:hypothetical protein